MLRWDKHLNPHAHPDGPGWRGGTPPKPAAGDFTRVRAIARAQLRLELTRFFYDPHTAVDKRCANVQVNKMMALLNEQREKTNYEGNTKEEAT